MTTSEEIGKEVEKFPLTGRFLMGRLRDAMDDSEKQIVESLVEDVADYDGPQTILERGQLSDRSTMLIGGFVLRTIRSGEKRFVVGVQVPGDFVDLHAFALKRLDHDVITIGQAKVGYVPHDRIKSVMDTDPHLARLLWFSTLLDAAIHREWIMKLEQLRAPRRVAHIFCELQQRLEFIGMNVANRIETPLIQADLADMCGTTAIHMNRALRDLREQGLADFQRGKISIPDREELCAFADFNADYLYGEGVLGMRGELDLSQK
ncbi:Crp/Fnr family transcriptional regulator [Aurantiacibacter gangjinensis]|uniref:Transcriptional regulator n=1 Tax=Aurantiacibacter gangjinensis TaxID=502682 RepID=A0A0G9MR59_9SPHN|nr:Crp/Fnr family transcriptional regulator [Aurantiacibacter gangjinensis]APE27812.1 cAMP-binding proteins - catabolite gene activator and regulatory subunit of cAMP-dependent protein kinase [Aurantiacibacter gangjinensis]KLE31798.1 transcriptional regulator [Aurantiacibacter gangjinensis]